MDRHPAVILLFSYPAKTDDLSSLHLRNRNLVFVVDDDAAMLKGTARLLRALGYASLLFPSADAIAEHKHFDRALCVLLDINLGEVSGIELRHRLRAASDSVPIIYMTRNDCPTVREAALQSGCLTYLIKPFSAASLAGALRRASAWRARAPMSIVRIAPSEPETPSLTLCESPIASPASAPPDTG